MNKNGVWSCDLCGAQKKYNHLLVVTNEDRNPPVGVYTTPVRADICHDCWKMVVDKMIGAGWARRKNNG